MSHVRSILFIASSVAWIVSSHGMTLAQTSPDPGVSSRASALKDLLGTLEGVPQESPQIHRTPEGYLRFIAAPPSTSFPVPAGDRATPQRAAEAFLPRSRNLFVDDNANVTFDVRRTLTHNSRSYVRFGQSYAGLPIRSAEIVVEVNAAGGVEAVMSDIMRDLKPLEAGKLSLSPTIDEAAARQRATDFVADRKAGLEFEASGAALMIYAPSVIGRAGQPQLVWETQVASAAGPVVRELVLIDAHTGDIAFHYSLVHYNMAPREVWGLNPPAKYKDEAGNYNEPWPVGAPVDLAWDYLGKTQEFYLDKHDRYGIDDGGMTTIARLDPTEESAYWDRLGLFMVFGYNINDPESIGHTVQDDCVGHEYTHGVTQYTSALEYQGESGAINEAFSDMWGEWIDLSDNDADDLSEKRWWFDEDYYATPQPFRNMKDPPDTKCKFDYGEQCTQQRPDYYQHPQYWYTGTTQLHYVHHNSGVGNKLCYLLTDGDSFRNHNVWGMGIWTVAGLFYECQYMLPRAADYYDLYHVLKHAASDLSDAERLNVESACQAVAIANDPLTHYWKLDEGLGATQIHEEDGYGDVVGTFQQGYQPSWVGGRTGGWALQYSGSYKRVQFDKSIDTLAQKKHHFTIAAWVKPTGTPVQGNLYRIFEQGGGAEYTCLFLEEHQGQYRPVYENVDESVTTTATSYMTIPTDEWSHVAAECDGQYLWLYVNWAPRGSASPAEPTEPNGADGLGYLGFNFQGIIDDVRIYRWAMSGRDLWWDCSGYPIEHEIVNGLGKLMGAVDDQGNLFLYRELHENADPTPSANDHMRLQYPNGTYMAIFDGDGNLWLDGSRQQPWVDPPQEGVEFIVRSANGPVMYIDDGNLYSKGELYEYW